MRSTGRPGAFSIRYGNSDWRYRGCKGIFRGLERRQRSNWKASGTVDSTNGDDASRIKHGFFKLPRRSEIVLHFRLWSFGTLLRINQKFWLSRNRSTGIQAIFLLEPHCNSMFITEFLARNEISSHLQRSVILFVSLLSQIFFLFFFFFIKERCVEQTNKNMPISIQKEL